MFQSGSASERLTVARQFVGNAPKTSEIVIVGSSRTAADDFVRGIAAGASATMGLHRFSFVQVAVQIARAELAQRGLAPLTATGAAAIALRSVFEARRRNELEYFTSVADKPGFSVALSSTIRELRASAIEPGHLTTLGTRGRDLSKLMADYLSRLAAAGLADAADLFAIAAEHIQDSITGLFSLPIVLADVAIVAKAEERFVAALASKSPDVLVTVVEGDARTIAALRRLGGEWSTAAKHEATSLERLQSFVFGSTPALSYSQDGLVEFFSAPGEGRECIEIARCIQQEAREGLSFDEIAIALRSPQTYTALLESALERGGIPAYFARGTRRPDASGRALLALLLCAEERLSAKRFAEYLSLGQVPSLDVTGAPPTARDLWVGANDDTMVAASAEESNREPLPDLPPSKTAEETNPQVSGMLRAPWKWEELLVEAAVVGGQERWGRRLKGLSAELHTRIEALKLEEPDSPQLLALERELVNLGHLRQYALPLVKVLSDLPSRVTWGEWLTALDRLASMALRRPEHVLAVLAELQPISSVGPVPLSEVREALSTRLSDLSVEPPSSRYGRVFVSTPEQLRGRSFAVVFVPGLAERIFPQKLREDPLLLDASRQQVTAADPPLLTMRDRAAEERLRLRIAAGSARRKVFFSYPRVEVALARPRVPSFYALDVRRTTLGTLPNVDGFEREAARNSGAELAWLAPENPQVAIDDVEHDLAVLRPLLQTDPATVRGRARYLMELSPELGRSLRARWQRWHKKWSPADGICEASEGTLQQLSVYRLADRAYSPTSLQAYAACPYKFLLSAIHRLEVREESAQLQMLDPLTRGGIYHSMLARFFRQAIADKLLPLGQANLARAYALTDSVVETTAAEYSEQLAPAIKRVWEDEIELLRADMRGLLGQMAEHPDGYLPELIEYSFGLPLQSDRDPASTGQAAILPEGFRLHGVIDLVEKSASANLRITDHKTGKNRTEGGVIVGHGEVLQPVLYSLGVERLLGATVAEARLSFCTATGGYTESTVAMNNAAREDAVKALKIIDQAVATGFLPAAPKEDGCKWCNFGSVCGPYEELRVSRKNQAPLAKLLELREMP
jgi:ATP-dependent helicase/nuclease subunit B